MADLSTQAQMSQQMYGLRAAKYDDSHHPKFAQHIVDSLSLSPGERLLDLACGTGLVTLPAAQTVGPTGQIVGVDITKAMLDELKHKRNASPDSYGNVKVYQNDITKLDLLPDLEKRSFDAISCASALVLLREPCLALLQWKEYLRPGGRLITDSTDIGNMPSSIAMERVYARLGLEYHSNRLWAVDGVSLKQILLQAGFEVEKVWFKESTGAGTKMHSKEDWEERFETEITKPSQKALVESGKIEQARNLFKQEWQDLANDDGKVKETDGVWVSLARKPLNTGPVRARGSCACGLIKWSTTSSPPPSSSNCLCGTCRKLSGSSHITFMDVTLNELSFDPPLGKPHLKTFQRSGWAERTFCGGCGSTVGMWYRNMPEVISIAAGTLDEEGSEEAWYTGPQSWIYTGECPKWAKLVEDGLRRNETMRDVAGLLGRGEAGGES